MSFWPEVIQGSFTRVKVLKLLSYDKQKSHLGMWHIKRFASSFCTRIRDYFWADIVHVDPSDEKRVQKGPNSVNMLNHVV